MFFTLIICVICIDDWLGDQPFESQFSSFFCEHVEFLYILSLLELYTTSVDVYYSSGWVLDEFNVEASCSFQHTTCDKVWKSWFSIVSC